MLGATNGTNFTNGANWLAASVPGGGLPRWQGLSVSVTPAWAGIGHELHEFHEFGGQPMGPSRRRSTKWRTAHTPSCPPRVLSRISGHPFLVVDVWTPAQAGVMGPDGVWLMANCPWTPTQAGVMVTPAVASWAARLDPHASGGDGLTLGQGRRAKEQRKQASWRFAPGAHSTWDRPRGRGR